MSKLEWFRFTLTFTMNTFCVWWAYEALITRHDFKELALVLAFQQLLIINERQRWLNARLHAIYKKFL